MKPAAACAVHNVQLQQFLDRATQHKDTVRRRAFAETLGERYEDLRRLAGAIRQHTLDYLDVYLERFIERATAAGTVVHVARDGEQANAIALEIARRHGCRLCVKSKSMVTEEIGLVPAFEQAGIETIETDLGEFILQLEGEPPSHIVTPMIHKDRSQVARAFVRELGAEYTEDPQRLTGIARAWLRERFRRADLGISGGNFLVAETGSLVICTNEGNAAFCTAGPPVHIALVGIEKIVPRLEHLAVLLKLLARSSTGQPLTAYTHILTGPRRDDEHDGPRELHIILLDNGRSEMLRPATREVLRCIRCGACLNACPVYRKVGGHAYGAVYSGPIGALVAPMLLGLENYSDLPKASSLCGACFGACPVHIDIPKHLIRLRAQMLRRRITGLPTRLAYRLWAWTLRGPRRYALATRLQRLMLRALAHVDGRAPEGRTWDNRGWLENAPGPLQAWTSQRDMPTPTGHSFRDWWERRERTRKDAE